MTFLKVLGLTLGVLALPMAAYLGGSIYSQYKIDRFCDSIGPGTRMQDLPRLADQAGVKLMGPAEMHADSGPYMYAIAVDFYTMGDYACSVHGEVGSGKITSKHDGF